MSAEAAKVTVGVVGGVNSVYYINKYLPDWLSPYVVDTFAVLYSIPWMEFFGALAVISLVVERTLASRLKWLEIKEKEHNDIP